MNRIKRVGDKGKLKKNAIYKSGQVFFFKGQDRNYWWSTRQPE